MTETNGLNFDRVLDLLAEKLAARLCEEPGPVYPSLSAIRQRVQMLMDGRPCVTLGYALSVCAKCGSPVEGAVHAPKHFGGLYCAGCCPLCANKQAGTE